MKYSFVHIFKLHLYSPLYKTFYNRRWTSNITRYICVSNVRVHTIIKVLNVTSMKISFLYGHNDFKMIHKIRITG